MQIALLLLRIAALQVERAYVILNIAVSSLVLGRIRIARRAYLEAKQKHVNRRI